MSTPECSPSHAAARIHPLLVNGDAPAVARELAAVVAAAASHGAMDAKKLLAFELIQNYAESPFPVPVAVTAGITFDVACLNLAILRAKPGDFAVWCPRANAYVGKHITTMMDCVRALLNAGAHRIDVEGHRSPLITALYSTWIDSTLIELLLQAQCDPNWKGSEDLTPLMMITMNTSITAKQRAATAARLVRARADVDLSTRRGLTALHYAVFSKNTDMFKVLADLGASMNVQADTGLTPMMAAITRGNRCCLRKLAEAGADVNFQHVPPPDANQDCADALTLAIACDDMDSVKILLELGAWFQPMFEEGCTDFLRGNSVHEITLSMRMFIRERVALRKRTVSADEAAEKLGMLSVVEGGDSPPAKRAGRRRKKKSARVADASDQDSAVASQDSAPAPVSYASAVSGSVISQDPAPAPVSYASAVASSVISQDASAVVSYVIRQDASAVPGSVIRQNPAPAPVSYASAVASSVIRQDASAVAQEGAEPSKTIRLEIADSVSLPLAEECVICMSAPKTTAMAPCGHKCVCDGCAASCFPANTQSLCPVCRCEVTWMLRVYD